MQKTDFKRFALMLDMSRSSIMNLPDLKKLTAEAASLGYNAMMLYTEDTYEIPDEPYFGHFRGRYSQAELKDYVAFCDSLGVEVIPCIQTLAHLYNIFRWPRYQKILDCNDILIAEVDETYELIDAMFRSVKECFHSKIVHIGMDEAHMVGLGKYLDRFGYQNRFQILSRHLTKVCEIAKKYDLEPLMWADMFFRLCNNGGYYDVKEPQVPDPKELNLPKEVGLTYWDYYYTEQSHYEKFIEAHQKLEQPLWFAGGIWSWTGFAPDNQFSFRATLGALSACRAKKVENVMMTLWSDNGGECLRWSTMTAIFAAARIAQGVTDEEQIKREFEERYHIGYDDFNLLDMHEPVEGTCFNPCVTNPQKYLLYNDPFLGICDSALVGNEKEYYTDLARKMASFGDHEMFGDLFTTMSYLSSTLSHKADLGHLTRTAYQAGDKEALRALVKEYDLSLQELAKFIASYRKLWLKENKPHGMEIHEIRLGGLQCRIASCRERLINYLENGVEIPELDEKPLDLLGGGEVMAHKPTRINLWGKILGPNPINND